jgi:exosortase E/protease (VPEID-CTERM system)
MVRADRASAAQFPRRILIGTTLLVAESLVPGSLPHPWFHPQQVMAAPIVFCAASLFFGRNKLAEAKLDAAPLNRLWLGLHGLAMAVLLATTVVLLHAPSNAATGSSVLVAIWYGSLVALAGTLVGALFVPCALYRALVGLRTAWLYAAITTMAVMSARTLVRAVWDAPNSRIGSALQTATLTSTKWLLHLFYHRVIAVPGTIILGTPRFRVQISGACSGIEGLALMLLLTVGWLIFARKELRLQRAVLLVPLALALSWMFNVARIAMLIALGDAGHPEIAVDGFHSEAGWILFNIVAIGFLLAMQKMRWLRKDATREAEDGGRNMAAAYLVPFLAVLAVAMLTHAASSGFDWLYPLRLAVASIALWCFRKEYRHLDWRFGWLGILAGIMVFGLWVGIAQWQHAAGSALAEGLAALPGQQRALWLTARALAAIFTVPLVEELAFRGYLARMIVSADVDTVPFARLSALAIGVSSLAFGLLHGRMWVAGTIAGVLFALAAKRRNRFGEAVAAHAVANLLIAAWVLARGDYSLW